MRDDFNFNMLPIVQDKMNHLPGVKTLTNLSSNGYYGYQPPLLDSKKEESEESHTCYMEVQFENNRKRHWNFGNDNDFREFKKRRQNESIPFACQPLSATPPRDAKSRKPTHNIPDMPRCIMGHYI